VLASETRRWKLLSSKRTAYDAGRLPTQRAWVARSLAHGVPRSTRRSLGSTSSRGGEASRAARGPRLRVRTLDLVPKVSALRAKAVSLQEPGDSSVLKGHQLVQSPLIVCPLVVPKPVRGDRRLAAAPARPHGFRVTLARHTGKGRRNGAAVLWGERPEARDQEQVDGSRVCRTLDALAKLESSAAQASRARSAPNLPSVHRSVLLGDGEGDSGGTDCPPSNDSRPCAPHRASAPDRELQRDSETRWGR
jgi:hypothetical protein